METTGFKSFNYLENGEVTYSIMDTIKTEKILDPGFYNISWVDYPKYIVEMHVLKVKEFNNSVTFPDKLKLDSWFDAFFEKPIKEKIETCGFLHKTGILLYGKEGTGKSTIIVNYCGKAIAEQKALVFYINDKYFPHKCWDFLLKIRKIQDNPIIIVFEEIDALIYEKHESFLKSALDGNLSIQNSIVFATTNYIDRIPTALKDRPSRFKFSLNIESLQDHETICSILKTTIGDILNEKEIEDFAKELNGSTLDHIKQFCLDKIMNLESTKKKVKTIGYK